ncbi:MAG: hypothetical protein J0I47_08840 [Sphingomonas sp.]|nr:hypothetical protein [Sphingomonas sp.]
MAMPARGADEELLASLARWSSLVLIPGMLFVFGLIYAVSPRHIPPTAEWADGTYTNACCGPLVLKNGIIKAGGRLAHYVVAEDKFGRMINVSEGIGVSGNAVKFGGTFVFVHFNDNSMAQPAIGEAKSMHLTGLDDDADFTFVKQK